MLNVKGSNQTSDLLQAAFRLCYVVNMSSIASSTFNIRGCHVPLKKKSPNSVKDEEIKI